jgi:glycosyltransferase involved in cell wall biosynthesis
LLLNRTLPVFPGGGGVEYLTTMHMASCAGHVGLVSMAHSEDDLRKTKGLVEAGVDLFLWKHLSPPAPPPPGKRPLLRRFLRLVARGLRKPVETIANVYRAGLGRPTDTLMLDRCFRNMAPHIRAALETRHYDILSVVESSAAAMIDYVPRPLVSILVMHDIRSLVYERNARVCTSRRERRRLLNQAGRYYKFERNYCRRYDLVVTVSEHDADWVREHYQPQRVITVPLPVDTEYFRPRPAAEVVRNRILFTGLMNHPPNTDAANFFSREVFPRIREVVPDAEFFIVGRNPPTETEALSSLPGVHVTGGVPDIRPWMSSAAVIVVPLRYGSGARQKILEAWAMEKFVVSTTVGAEGLEYQSGMNLAIADDAQTMAATVIRALVEPACRDHVRFAGRPRAIALHDPGQIASDYYRRVKEVASDKIQEQSPMRIVIDLRWMLPGLAGGIENVARSFIRNLSSLDRQNLYTVLVPARSRFDFDLRQSPNIKLLCPARLSALLAKFGWKTSSLIHRRLGLDYWRSADVEQLRFLSALDAEIVYSMPGYIFSDLFPLRHVLMVPDIQHEYLPEFFSPMALDVRNRAYRESIHRADCICAISEFTRQTLISRLGVAAAKITAVPLAADPIFRPEPEQDDARRLQKYGLRARSYLLFPGHTWQHKNHRAAIAALKILREKYSVCTLLVCTGEPREAQPTLEAQIVEEGSSEYVRFLGYCPRADMPALYRNASCLVYPSWFEGFGMPVLESMSCGCPVVCSNTTSLPEVAGDAALFVDPRDHERLADEVNRTLSDNDLQNDLRTRGLRRASKFSWRRHTLEIIRVFHRAHKQSESFLATEMPTTSGPQ